MRNAVKMIATVAVVESGQMLESGEKLEMLSAVKIKATVVVVETGQILETGQMLEMVNAVRGSHRSHSGGGRDRTDGSDRRDVGVGKCS